MAQGIPSYDTDSDDELPHGWEERSTQEGFVFYANHLLKKTQWENPKTQRRKRVSSELPYGWERNVDEQERVFYVDHINKRTTYTDPRLAFAFDLEEDNIARDVRQRFDGSTYADEILEGRDLSGKVAIVTGANSGIGYETARALAHHGAKVVLACRNLEKGQAAADRIQLNRKDVNVLVMELDLASLRSIRKFAHDFLSSSLPLNYLILNAGVFALPWALTEDKIERTFATNHVGHFYLTKLLTDMLIKSAPARVVVVSSESHRFDSKSCELNLQDLNPLQHEFWAYQQYNRSKLCNVLFSNELNRKLRSHGVSCNSLHPGNMMYTSLCESTWYYKLIFFLARPFTKTMKQGAACSVFVATARELEGVGGLYFNNCYRCEPSDMAKDRKLATKLWKMTEELIEDRLRLIPGT